MQIKFVGSNTVCQPQAGGFAEGLATASNWSGSSRLRLASKPVTVDCWDTTPIRIGYRLLG